MLQPFSNFEGRAPGSKEREVAFSRAKGWIKIMAAVGMEMLQDGSSDSPSISRDFDVLASDLRELVDLLAEHGFSLCYENWCWATAALTWSDVWEIAKRVDRPNIGLCLDTFQTVGGENADPTTKSGRIVSQGLEAKLELTFKPSIRRLIEEVPAEKIFVLQIGDAYRPPVPFQDEVVDSTRPRGRWSRDFRPFLWNGGACTEQCVLFTKAVLATGARCCFSTEVFDGGEKREVRRWGHSVRVRWGVIGGC